MISDNIPIRKKKKNLTFKCICGHYSDMHYGHGIKNKGSCFYPNCKCNKFAKVEKKEGGENV